MIAIKLWAKSDRNGNPRQVYVVLDDMGSIVETIDEGYIGATELFGKYPEMKRRQGWPVAFETTPREYKRLLREGKE